MGILLHVILTSCFPYSGDEEEVDQRIIHGAIELLVKKLPKDDSLILLLKQMLTKDPAERPTISEVLQSEWLNVEIKHETESETLTPQIVVPKREEKKRKNMLSIFRSKKHDK